MRAQLLMGAEAPQARAEARANQALMRGRLAPFAEMRAKYEAVTAQDVQAAAAAAIAAPAAAAAIGPKAGLGAAEGFVARFA
jgi:predicted Zn-dependent peptidase